MKIAIVVLTCLLAGSVGAYAEQRYLIAESLAAMGNGKVRALMSTFKKDDSGYVSVNSPAGETATLTSDYMTFNDADGQLRLSISADNIIFYADGKAVKVISAK